VFAAEIVGDIFACCQQNLAGVEEGGVAPSSQREEGQERRAVLEECHVEVDL